MSHFISADGSRLGLGQVAESVCAPASSDLPEGEGVGTAPSCCLVGLPVFFLWFYSTPFLSIFTTPSDCVEQAGSLRHGLQGIFFQCMS